MMPAEEMLTPPQHYWGAITDLVKQGWGQCFGRHRDSDVLENANFDSVLEIFEEQGYELNEDYRIETASHFLVGWADTMLCRILGCECESWEDSHITKHPDWESKGNKTFICHVCNTTAKFRPIYGTVLNIVDRLSEYPVLDEDKLSEMEWDEDHPEWDDKCYSDDPDCNCGRDKA